MLLVGRRLLGRVSKAYDEVGHVPTLWLGAIFVGVLLSAFVAQQIGIAAIFGAFIMGLIMPRRAGLTADVSERFESFVVLVLLPLFFVVTGLRTEVNALNRPVLWALTLLLIAVAIAGKFLGAMLAARYGGFSLRDSAAIGALMNTRGLTELIVLNIGLDLGVISTQLFTMLVVMALVTTFMAGPILRLIDPRHELSEPVEEELRQALRQTDEIPVPALPHAILVAPQDEKNLDALLALAEPLAKTTPPRELVIAQVVIPDRFVTGTSLDAGDVELTSQRLDEKRAELAERGVAARAFAFTSILPGEDYVRLASEDAVDLVLLDGRRPLLGEGVPRGPVGEVLERAPCDVAVLVERAGMPAIDPQHPVMVPFGGGDHDWAALELAAWIATAHDTPLKLLGATGLERGRRKRGAGLRLARRAAAGRGRDRGDPRRPGERRPAAGDRGRRPARDRPVRALARRGSRAGALGDRQGRAGADPVRPPRHPAGRARAAHRRPGEVLLVACVGLFELDLSGIFRRAEVSSPECRSQPRGTRRLRLSAMDSGR